jgi:exosortase/archaeosortase
LEIFSLILVRHYIYIQDRIGGDLAMAKEELAKLSQSLMVRTANTSSTVNALARIFQHCIAIICIIQLIFHSIDVLIDGFPLQQRKYAFECMYFDFLVV